MKAKLNEIIKHGHLGIIAAFFAIYMVTFSYIENRDVHHYIVHTVLDEKIPFCEYFIIPYLLWFIFVAVTVLYFMFFNQNKWKEYYQLMITLGIGMTLFLVISFRRCSLFIIPIHRQMYCQVFMYSIPLHAAWQFFRISGNILRKQQISQ